MTSKDPAHDAPITHDKYEDGFRDGLNQALKIIDKITPVCWAGQSGAGYHQACEDIRAEIEVFFAAARK